MDRLIKVSRACSRTYSLMAIVGLFRSLIESEQMLGLQVSIVVGKKGDLTGMMFPFHSYVGFDQSSVPGHPLRKVTRI